jgi:hypothetical protein
MTWAGPWKLGFYARDNGGATEIRAPDLFDANSGYREGTPTHEISIRPSKPRICNPCGSRSLMQNSREFTGKVLFRRSCRKCRPSGHCTGMVSPAGSCYTHPAFKFRAGRIIRKIMQRFANHPAVIGHQVDSEPGLLALPQPRSLPALHGRAPAPVRTVENLNKEWGLFYWSPTSSPPGPTCGHLTTGPQVRYRFWRNYWNFADPNGFDDRHPGLVLRNREPV